MTMEEKDTEDWGTPIYYTQHPSLRKLTPLEKQFLLAVEHGDAPMVKKMVALTQNSHPSVDINCMDSVGRSATLMAIDNENLDILVLLLESGAESRDALLHAINAEYVEAVDLLLEHEEIIYKEGDPHSWERVDRDISTFAPEITPLILAAHKNNYEILKLLLDRGATLPMPHDVRCCCNECVTSNEQDCLCHSRSRINAYRALSSPSLICLSSIDPILTAFELSWELRRLSNIENEFKDDYQKLRSRCQDFATSLLDHARSSHELEIVLNYDPTRPPYQQGEHMPLSRVQMAIKYKQKKFIAHPNVQQLMSTLWYDGLPGFRRQHPVHQLWNIIKIGVLFPFYSAMYMLLPHSGHGKLIKKPFFKFILHSFSYLFFLFLLILASQRVETLVVQWFGTEKMKMELAESMKMQRGQLPTIIETSIFLYIIAHIWQETRELWTKGLVAYFQNMWNIIDFTRNSLYVATVGLRTLAYFQARSEILANPMSAYIPREDWDAFDPTLIADGLFAAGNIFAALKLVHIFSINPYLGPLQISLGRMVIDIIKFFFIYTLVLFAFACGLNQLLWYYADMEKQQCYSGPGGTENWVTHRDSCLAWRRFSNLFESSQSLFWASFGLVDISNFELTGIKSYTRFWGLLMFGSYSVINVVVLLNLLIAMMSNSYNIISERADVEWKFARTTLFMNYFDEGGTVPPPFNLFPKVKNIIRLLGKKKSVKDWSITRKEKTMKERDTIYQNVMCNLVWRYVTAQQKVVDSLPVTEDNINEVRQDVAAFRHDLMHVLRANGVNTKDVEVEKLQDVAGKRIQINKRRLMKDFSIGLMEVFTEDAAPEVRENKSVLARLVGLSATESRSSQRWRDLIQLAKKSKIIGNRDSTRFGSLRQSSLRSDDEPEECNNTQVSQQPEKEESLQQSSILNAPRNTMVSKKLLSPIPSPRSLIKESDAHQVRNNSPRKLAPPIPVSTQPQSQETININNLVQTSPSMDSTNKTQSVMDKMLFINKISEELVLKPLNHESTIDANQKIKYDKQVIQKTLQHSKNEKKNEDIFENDADVPTPPKPKAGRNVAMLPLDAKIESKIEEESGRKVESPLNKKNNTSINSEDEVQQIITEKTKSVANIPILKRDTTIIVPSTPECSPKKATMPPDTIITTDMMHQRSKADTTVSTKYNSAGNLKVKEEAKSVLISVTDFLEEKSFCMNKKEMGPKSLNESEEDKARLAILERQMAPCTTEIELNPSISKESSAKKLMEGGSNAQSAVATVEGSVSKIPSTIKGCVKTLGSRKGWI